MSETPRPTVVKPAMFGLILFSVAFSLRYLHWRATATLNHASDGQLVLSVVLLAAECYGFLTALLFFVQVLSPKRNARVPLRGTPPTVDVLITVCEEPADILRETLVACRALDYPADRLTVYVCDDGNRDENRRLAETYGARYLSRTERRGAKAGNLNHGLGLSKSELLMILDVDHIPVRSFLQETVGFFQADEQLAFVQTPHHFYNPDCYQRNLTLERELVHEQDLFFQLIEPGRDSANAVMFAGSSAVFRRVALEQIGGFRTDCAVEDLHTGMELQARGWHSLYSGTRILTAGLSPEDFEGYLTQRKRWCRGGVQLFFLDNPLIKKGLSLAQRLNYAASLLYFFHGLSRLIFILAPLSFLLLGMNPILAPTGTLILYFLPHYLFSHVAFELISGEYRHPFWSDVYEAAGSFALAATAILTLFRPDSYVFKVTPKGIPQSSHAERVPWASVLPHITVMMLLAGGIIHATIQYEASHLSAGTYALNCAWTVFNFFLLACAVEVAREMPRKRHAIRFARRLKVSVGEEGKAVGGVTVNVSRTGALVLLDHDELLPTHAPVRITADGEHAQFDCEVRRVRWTEGKSMVGLHFTKMTDQRRDQLTRLLFCLPNTWDSVHRPASHSVKSFFHIATSLSRKRRRGPGAAGGSPTDLVHAGGTLSVHLEELHADHAIVTWPDGTRLEGALSLRLPHPRKGTLVVSVEQGDAVGAARGTRTHRLAFVSPARIATEPVLEAIEGAQK